MVGDGGLGIHVGPGAMRRGIAKAKEYGMGVATVANAGHLGGAGYHATLAAKAGMLGHCMAAPGGGQMVQASTVNKLKLISSFKQSFKGAPANGWAGIFMGYEVRPGRDEAWYERTKRNAPLTPGMTPDLYMEPGYPRTATEALAPARPMAALDRVQVVSVWVGHDIASSAAKINSAASHGFMALP